MFFSEAQALEEFEFEAARHDYPNAMAAEAAFQHRNGGTCSFDCWACDPDNPVNDPDYDAAAVRARLEARWATLDPVGHVPADDLPF